MCQTTYSNSCPQNCTCYHHVVRCSHAELTRIPYEEMPMNTEELYLDSNNIEEIPFGLANHLIYLRRIDLSYNKITTFDGMKGLTKLIFLVATNNFLKKSLDEILILRLEK